MLSRLLLRNRFSTRTLAAYLVVEAIGLVAISATGYTGGELVYEHGVEMNSAPRLA